MKKHRYRTVKGVRYISYRKLNSYEEAMIEVLTLRRYGVKTLKPYNNYSKRNWIVYVMEIEDFK